MNLSARQFQQRDLVEIVRRTLADDAASTPASLELEITETTAMQNAELTHRGPARAARASASAISIDDFGTGYSSLNYLKRFPIDAVKIDRAFVARPGDERGRRRHRLRRHRDGAQRCSLRVVAEGVETEEQFAFLQREQCDEAQGFYFSRRSTPATSRGPSHSSR